MNDVYVGFAKDFDSNQTRSWTMDYVIHHDEK